MSSKIRVLHCLSSVANGGVERRRLILARGLDPKRYEQRIIARAARGDVRVALEQAGVPVTTVGQGHLFDAGALWRATRLARAWQPDIVHGAVFEGLSLAVVAGRLCRARVVIEETSFATNRSPRGHALFRALVAASDACVAISPAVKRQLCERTGVPEQKITMIMNGVVPPRLPSSADASAARAALGIAASAFVIGTVARLQDDGNKRVSDLVRALARIADEAPDVHLLVVGEGSAKPGLIELAKSLGIQQRVTFTGNREDVGNMYAIMNVFSLVSAWEGFGLVVAEAMFCGLPVLGSRVGGIPDIVIEGETGLLVPACDPPAIAQAMLQLRRSPERCAEFGRAGKLRAEGHFSAERYTADVEAFYTKLLQGR
jgi:glycosyltransferase involved in cell wall biosynthesis